MNINIEAKVWVQTLALRPGDMVLVKVEVPPGMPHERLHEQFGKMKDIFREGLDKAGHVDTQILVCASNIDISVIPAVDLLGVLTSGVSADQEPA